MAMRFLSPKRRLRDGSGSSIRLSNVILAGLAMLLMTGLVTGCTVNDTAGGMESATMPDLAGSKWRLLEIAGMDDSSHRPDDPAHYTLAFLADDHAVIRADCNRGSGKWSSNASGMLTFGVIASTRALCPPESISELYLKQFQWVRTYQVKSGHLFLATMADGAILEFEPDVASLPVVADVREQ